MGHPYDGNTYRCELLRVVDGDTLQLRADLGLRCERTLYIRLADINVPEIRRGPAEDRQKGRAATDYARQVFEKMASDGQPVYARFRKGKSFDRWVGWIFTTFENGDPRMDFGDEMVKAGYAVRV